MKSIICFFLIALCSCTLMKKESLDNQMEKLGEEVLKHHEGLEIDFKPIPIEKK